MLTGILNCRKSSYDALIVGDFLRGVKGDIEINLCREEEFFFSMGIESKTLNSKIELFLL